eukprot:6856885-Pyramimonas_sp.AAC.1
MAPSLPHVGHAGARRQTQYTTNNGGKLLTILQDTGMQAVNTFGPVRRQNGTWLHTDGKSWRTIDFICTRLQGCYGHHAHPLRQLPVSMG